MTTMVNQKTASIRKFNPLPADHPSIGEICPGCSEPIKEGDVVTLVAIGPGDNPEARAKARDGKAYTGVAVPAHWACVTGEGP